MKDLLKKVLWIEEDLGKIKKEIQTNIANEEVSITMTKREWEEIQSLCYSWITYQWSSYYYHSRCNPKWYDEYQKLQKLISKA